MVGRGSIRSFAPIQHTPHGLSILLGSGGRTKFTSAAGTARAAQAHLRLLETGPPQPGIALVPGVIFTPVPARVVLAESESDPRSQSSGTARPQHLSPARRHGAWQRPTLLHRRTNYDPPPADSSHLIQLPGSFNCHKQPPPEAGPQAGG